MVMQSFFWGGGEGGGGKQGASWSMWKWSMGKKDLNTLHLDEHFCEGRKNLLRLDEVLGARPSR